MKRKQLGFTAFEVIIALAVVAALAVTVLGPFGSYIDQAQKEESRKRVKELKLAVQEAYRRELMSVGAAGGSTMRLGGIDIANGSLATASLFAPLEHYASLSAGRLVQDGYNQAHRVFVSNELTQVVAGATLAYRVVALVSVGHNGTLDCSFDAATGTITLGGDDIVEVVNGYAIVREAYDDAQRKLQAVSAAYQNYFLTRYQTNPARSVAVDYFANTDPGGSASPNWDGAGSVLTSGGAAVDADAVNLRTALGLSPDDLKTTFGQQIQVDNSSSDVNHPDHPAPTRTLPPYSARLVAPLPGGNQAVMTVTGIYN